MASPLLRRLLLAVTGGPAVCLAGEALAKAHLASHLARALLDSCTHGAVGATVWCLALLVATSPGQLPWERRSGVGVGGAGVVDDEYAGDKRSSVGAAATDMLGAAFAWCVPRWLSSGQPDAGAAAGGTGAAAPARDPTSRDPDPAGISQRPFQELLLASSLAAGAVACALDADHFIMARSLSLSAATSLASRPFGHAVAWIAAVSLPLSLVSVPWGVLVVIAWGSHQLRDALRRGLWLWPGGSTPPIPLWTYCGGCVALSLLCAIVLRRHAAALTFAGTPSHASSSTSSVSSSGLDATAPV